MILMEFWNIRSLLIYVWEQLYSGLSNIVHLLYAAGLRPLDALSINLFCCPLTLVIQNFKAKT
jgi:hypothetical protein